jgi:hypothetical protein
MSEKRGEILMIVGAVLMVLAPVLTFVTIKVADQSKSFNGFDAEQGSSYVLGAIIVAAMAIGLFFVGSGVGRKVMAVVGLAAAAFFGIVAGFVDKDPGQYATGLGSGVSASAGIGPWLAIIGGILAVVGSVLALKTDRVATATPTTTTTTTTPPATTV